MHPKFKQLFNDVKAQLKQNHAVIRKEKKWYIGIFLLCGVVMMMLVWAHALNYQYYSTNVIMRESAFSEEGRGSWMQYENGTYYWQIDPITIITSEKVSVMFVSFAAFILLYIGVVYLYHPNEMTHSKSSWITTNTVQDGVHWEIINQYVNNNQHITIQSINTSVLENELKKVRITLNHMYDDVLIVKKQIAEREKSHQQNNISNEHLP